MRVAWMELRKRVEHHLEIFVWVGVANVEKVGFIDPQGCKAYAARFTFWNHAIWDDGDFTGMYAEVFKDGLFGELRNGKNMA